jgi:hypothetical protein
MSSVLLPVLVGLAVGIAVIVIFSTIYLNPEHGSTRRINVYELAECKNVECVVPVVMKCQVQNNAIVQLAELDIWLVDVYRIENGNCRADFASVSELSTIAVISGSMHYSCIIPLSELDNAKLTTFQQILQNVSKNPVWHCGLSMP